jgi:hypothetical protein
MNILHHSSDDRDENDNNPNQQRTVTRGRQRTNFDLIGDAYFMRFRMPAAVLEDIYRQIAPHMDYRQSSNYALTGRQKMLVALRFDALF